MDKVTKSNNAIYGVKAWIIALISIFAVISYPVLFLYFQNAEEVRFIEVISPLFVFMACGLIVFIISVFIAKSVSLAALITNFCMLIVLNYAFIEKIVYKIFPMFYYWHVYAILVFGFIILARLLYKKISADIANSVVLVIGIVFGSLIVLNGIVAFPTIIKKITVENKTLEHQAEDNKTEMGELPNIYFLLFDEYSSIDFMRKYYNYDNSAFESHLLKDGFNISYTSHNDSISTTTVTTNLLNLNYIVNDKTSTIEKDFYRKNNYLFGYLNEKGYAIKGVGSVQAYGLVNSVSEKQDLSAKTVTGETIKDIIYKNTIIRPLYKAQAYTEAQKLIISAFEYLADPKNYSKNSFTFAHIVCPHEPFYFNKEGIPYKNPTSNWKDDKYYLEQYIFTTNKIIEIIDSIISNDPESIIILQSDHSARASSDPDLSSSKFLHQDKTSIFNAVYYKGEKLDIEGLSGVNTLRSLLNKLFNENFEVIELPSAN